MIVHDHESFDERSVRSPPGAQFGISRMLLAIGAIGGALALIRGGSDDGLYLAAGCIAAGALFGVAFGIMFRNLLLWTSFGACAALAVILWVALGFRG